MKKYESHPIADCWPMLEADELESLASDIKENGLLIPISLYEGKILDGRNRYAASMAAGVDPQFIEYSGDNPIGYVFSMNEKRRHQTTSQRAMAAAKIANMPEGRNWDNCSLMSSKTPCSKMSTLATSQADASKALKVSRTSVQNAKAVLDHGTPELIAAVERGMIPVTKAAEISRMKDSVQQNKTITKLTEKPHVSHNSGNNEWYTPPEIIEAARATMGRIDCDPASSELANKTVKAKKYYTAEQNGLERKWGEKVWLNPPYSQPAINHFADALSQRVKDKEIKEACILVNNATDAAWCQKILMLGSCVCFLRGRVKFIDMEGCATGAPLQGQIVVYIGENIDDFKANFTSMGVILFYME